ncbi:SMP-30/gluconolactonase/LRE family protein [Ensifer sp. YR511]|uniref:SMP-30/gluconolactonase/LRE family protein n=1 Tax=Ensifer sp. YR511 TaxID=1855294 RepID=UPI00088A1EE8|nr:SMP-30/gluconolactonase/LRE family protein [Ensifer sp. YR511]SDN41084.1 gluconolactonase [Ensifer sp. YR511]
MIFDVRKPELEAIILPGAVMETIAEGYKLTEGIIWHHKDDYLIYSDMAHGKVYKWKDGEGVSVIKTPSNITNGNFVDAEGRIISCEHATSRVTRMEPDGRYMSTLATHFDGKELNSPNDIIADSKGRIWFTDPAYGRTSPAAGLARPQQLDYQGVYRLDPDGTLTLLAKDFGQPNGLCLEPGEGSLLVNDTPRDHIRRFKVDDDGTLSGGEVIAELKGEEPGKADGLKVDEEGRIYCTGPGGVHVFAVSGELLGVIRTPDQCRNFCFGGSDRSELYFATSSAIFRLKTKTRGVAFF